MSQGNGPTAILLPQPQPPNLKLACQSLIYFIVGAHSLKQQSYDVLIALKERSNISMYTLDGKVATPMGWMFTTTRAFAR